MAEARRSSCSIHATSGEQKECDEKEVSIPGVTVQDILTNDLIAGEIFKYLCLCDLRVCYTVNKYWNLRVRTHIRDKCIWEASLSGSASPCTSLSLLEANLESMLVIPYTGLRLYVNLCRAHPSAKANVYNSAMIEVLYPNILNRLTLKHLWVYMTCHMDSACWLCMSLIRTLCELNASLLEKFSMSSRRSAQDSDFIRFVVGVQTYPFVKTVHLDSGSLSNTEMEDFVSSFPKLQELTGTCLPFIPPSKCHFVKRMTLSHSKWDIDPFGRPVGRYEHPKLKFLLMSEFCFEIAPNKAYQVFEQLLHSSRSSLETLVIRGSEFPKWSQLNTPRLLSNLNYLQIAYSLDELWFLKELGRLCKSCPVLKDVYLIHIPYDAHYKVLPEDEVSEIDANIAVSMLRIEGFYGGVCLLMKSLADQFPNVKELHLIGSEKATFEWAFKLWPFLECLVIGRLCSYWSENYDHIFLGVNLEEIQLGQLSELTSRKLHYMTPIRPSLTCLRDLRRFYILGGNHPESEHGENPFMSEQAATILLERLPKLVFRIVPGFNKSVLSHLVRLDNSDDNIWCPLMPKDLSPTVRGCP